MTKSIRRDTPRADDARDDGRPARRRAFLRSGAALAGAAVSGAAGIVLPQSAHAAEGAAPSQKVPGIPAGAYGQPSEFEKSVTRHVIRAYPEIAPGVGSTLAPIQSFHGT